MEQNDFSTSQKNGGIQPLEMESLNPSGKRNGSNNTPSLDRLSAASLPQHPCDRLLMMIKLSFELYPKVCWTILVVLCLGVVKIWAPWQSVGNAERNYMSRDYTDLEVNFNFQSAQIDHWCLFGGDDHCACDDPTEQVERSEVHGWAAAHDRNKQLVTQAVGALGGQVDVVFLGDQTVQTWDGRWMDRPAPEGSKVWKYYNQTFGGEGIFTGLALGIYGDRLNNILWRINHGELPLSINAKVFWLIAGTNDLALTMCSEEVVTLGIMRIAEELHHHYPDAIVVIQGILPRSNHADGSLDANNQNKGYGLFNRNRVPYKKPTKAQWKHSNVEKGGGGGLNAANLGLAGPGNDRRRVQQKSAATTTLASGPAGQTQQYHADPIPPQASQPRYDYYLWPSIQTINKELAGFCAKHQHFVYFDADDMILGSIGNDHYRAPHKQIVTQLMPDYVHLSFDGHKVLMDAINKELQNIIFEDDETNDIETKGNTKKSRRHKRVRS